MNGGNFSEIASMADTGQWRLIISISQVGMSALLRNITFEGVDPIVLLNEKWRKEPSGLLSKVEETVYDNPRLLEDFATQIIVDTPKALWVPAEITDEEEFDSNLFTCVYPAEPEDIFADFGNEEVCLYSLVAGLGSFLKRTMPGCRIFSNLTVLKRYFEDLEIKKLGDRTYNESLKSIYVNIGRENADIFAFKNGKMLCGATHYWKSHSDIGYKIALISDTYNLDSKETDIITIGTQSDCENLRNCIKDLYSNITIILSTPFVLTYGVTLSASLEAGENPQLASYHENH